MSKSLLLLAMCFLLQSSHWPSKTPFVMPYDYTKAWKEVAESENRGLPESALKIVNEIYQHAKSEKNAGQLVKAIIHQLKFIDSKEENSFIKNISRLKEEAQSTSFPVKPLLHSMLAEMYWQYYQNNRYRFYDRSEITNADEKDIETWSLEKIVKETLSHYTLSLEEAGQSKQTPVDLYEPVIHQGNTIGRSWRPTLYDFLAHRALNFFSGEEPGITQPAETFILNDESYFSPAEAFVNLTLSSPDDQAMKLHALKLMQDLIRFHLNDDNPWALAEIDLQRLDFLRAHATLGNKNELYLSALDLLEAKINNHPHATRMAWKKAMVFVETGSRYKPLISDEHKWDKKTAYQICETALKRFPDSDGTILCENLQQDISSKSIQATVETTNTPDEAFRCLVQYRNFSQLHYRMVKVTREEVKQQRQKWATNSRVDREQKFLEYFTSKTPHKSGAYKLPDDGDYQEHSIEVKLDALPEGEYMILFSHNADFGVTKNGIAYAFTVVSNITYIHRNVTDGGTEFHLLHRQTGEPLAGVKADVFHNTYNYKKQDYEQIRLGTYTSNKDGYFKVDFVANNYNQRNFLVNFIHKNDFNSTEGIDKHGYDYYERSIYQYKQEPPRERMHTFFFLDRAIYRPGQTIYFKGLVITTDGKTSTLQPNYATTVALYDVNSQKQAELEVTTNDYGSFSGTFIAPSSGLLGEMEIRTPNNTGSVSFSVEEYKRPKFEVAFEPVKGSFKLNEIIAAQGYARTYSGANLDGAGVQYRVVREARFPFWWWSRWGHYPSSPAVEITNGKTQTDANGNFSIEFKALPDASVDPSSDPRFQYTVYADVTDRNGETHSSSTTVSVGYKALALNVPMANIDKQNTTHTKREIPIVTSNLAGEHEAAKGTIRIYSLKSPAKAFRSRLWQQPDRQLYSRDEYYKFFPHDLYDDENNTYTWPREKEVFSLTFDTEKKTHFQISNLDRWNEGEYVLEITANDKYDEPVKEVSYFTVFSAGAKGIPTAGVHYFQAVKVHAEPGEVASFLTGTSSGKIKVLYELEQDGAILSKAWITLNNQQKVFEIPIREEHRGNVTAHYTFVKNNRLYNQDITITVPFTNKQLDISFQSFRDKLQPGENEQWKIRIAGKKADKVAAEMVATLYDASLDQFRPHGWGAYFFNATYSRLSWKSQNGFRQTRLTPYTKAWNAPYKRQAITVNFDVLNWFGYDFYYHHRRIAYKMDAVGAPVLAESEMLEEQSELDDNSSFMVVADQKADSLDRDENTADFSTVKARTNFNETAFYFPHLQTNEQGEILINFTIPEALTRWKMLGFAHTKDLQSGLITNELVTQKELMVVPNPPRFFREGDNITFASKITSLADHALSGQAQLEFFDALTMKPIDVPLNNKNKTRNFSVEPRQSTNLEWSIDIPEGLQAITYRIVARAGNFSDGEEMIIPVVTNRMLVTESLPLPIRGKQTKNFRFEKMLTQKSSTLRHQQYTLEFTSNPAWYAVQALPYLMEYPYDCVEQTFSRYYANTIASHIANSHPRIKEVFDAWKNIQPDALLSNLKKNQELKSALLEETPWVLQAQNEKQRKHNVGVLFDLNRMAGEQQKALDKVLKAQTPNGGFAWFNGMPEDRYMTQHIVSGMGHLDALEIKSVRNDRQTWTMITKALTYLDQQIKRDYDRLKEMARRGVIKLDDKNIGYTQFHYLYTRSYFKDIEIRSEHKQAFQYFLSQARKYWLSNNIYMEGMAALALHRFGEKNSTSAIIKSLNERALQNEEMGMYWKSDRGYYWYQAPIETQALMIEVFDEVASDTKAVEALKVWLLKQKQTQDWKTTKATVEACYALLRKGTDLLANTKLVEVKVGDNIVDPFKGEDSNVEAGTGYFKTSWQAEEITASMGYIRVSKSDEGVAWGAVYWQYLEQLDKITPAETPLKLKKELYLQQRTERGPVITPVNDKTTLTVGDLLNVRIELRTDRDMEYVHLKDMRAAAFEPVSTLSMHRYQDGLYYYESPRDLATNFFIGYLPKGTYVFEYSLRVSQKGNFSNGITTIQCMYAPEFASHSEGIRVRVE